MGIRVQQWGGAQEEDLLSVERYDDTDTVSGSWVADESRTVVLVFDNSYSKLRSKCVAYIVGIEKPHEEATPAPATDKSHSASHEQPASQLEPPLPQPDSVPSMQTSDIAAPPPALSGVQP